MSDQLRQQERNDPRPLKERDINKWIEKGVTTNTGLVKQAEASAKLMANKGLTKSQFRNVFEEIRRIETLINEKGEESTEAFRALLMLQPKLAYLEKRDSSKAGFKELRKLLRPAIDKLAEDFSKKTFNHFIDLVEALLGFHYHHADQKDKS